MKTLIAYHGDPKIKEKYVARVLAHKEADQIIKGKYWEDGKGCAVGCTVHSSSHAAYEVELGIPRQLARIEDGIFESLPNKLAINWPLDFLESIPVGANLYPAYWHFMQWLLIDDKEGVIRFAKTKSQVKTIGYAGNIYSRLIAGEHPTFEECMNIRAAAAAADAYAYAYAAYAAAAAAAAYADADAAAAAAADAAACAAYAAYAAADAAACAAYAAYAAARTNFRIIQSEKLLELLKQTQPTIEIGRNSNAE